MGSQRPSNSPPSGFHSSGLSSQLGVPLPAAPAAGAWSGVGTAGAACLALSCLLPHIHQGLREPLAQAHQGLRTGPSAYHVLSLAL